MSRGVLGLIGAGALALAGCGGSQKTVTVTAGSSTSTSTGVASSSTATAASTSTASTSSTTATSSSTTTAAPPLSVGTFQSPSGNIGCIIAGGLARCDIKQRGWSPPPRPSSCPKVVDFGQGLEVSSSGAGRFVCAGDTALDPAAAKLAYGASTLVDGITCSSATNGMTCRNSGGGGFFISIQGYKTF